MGFLNSTILHPGIKDVADDEKKRHLILSSYIALAIVIMGVVTVIAASFENPESFPKIAKVTYGTVFMALSGLLGLIFSRIGWFNLSRLVISVFPITVLQLYPILSYQVIDEFYFWYPFAIVVSSIIPQIIFSYKKEKTWYMGILIYFFIYLLFIDELMIHFTTEKVSILPIVEDHQFFYKLVPLLCFAFTVFAITYLKKINSNYQDKLASTNEELTSTLEELKVTQQHLIQSEKMSSLGTLTAGVAHEINNPLNFISGGINVIKEMKEELESKKLEDLNERCKTATEMLGTGLDRVSGIVKSLMTFSQRGTPRLIEYNIHQLIDNTLLFINKKITDDIEIARDFKLKEKVAVYPEKIHFIFTNILDNAIFFLKKHEPARKKIVISTIRTNNNASIRIFNTGPNIPDEQLTKVFDPFFTTKDPEQGTGLGLSICYTFINEHNGRIYAENEENGVSFVVELPVSVK